VVVVVVEGGGGGGAVLALCTQRLVMSMESLMNGEGNGLNCYGAALCEGWRPVQITHQIPVCGRSPFRALACSMPSLFCQ
jgi:hypothetical protein